MNMKKKDPESTEMTFFEHIDALRPHLVRGVMAIGVIGLVAFFCKSFIIDTVLFGPQSPDFPTNRMLTWVGAQWAHMAEWLNSVLGTSFDTDPETFRIANDRFSIINTSLSGQFNLHMKISLLTGLAMAMPYTLWEFWRFVRPALTPKEIQGTHLFVFWVSLCFFLTTVIIVSIACAFMFELPLLIYFLTRMGLVSAGFLRKYRRHAFVILLVVAAIITPPDIFSLILVILPLYGLYELSIKLAERTERKHAAEEEQTTEMTETTE